MVELLIALIVFTALLAPLILSIIALAKVSVLRKELDRLAGQPRPAQVPVAMPAPARTPAQSAAAPQPAPAITAEQERVPPRPPLPARPARNKAGLEFMLGGRAASFAGIGILVMGIVFLVSYSIQQGWIGPGTRIVLGLLWGGALTGVGHWADRRDEKYRLIARVLTGGGCALFYFCVFAAYGIYHLIGVWIAGAGLFASALAVFGLSLAYGSQSVAVLGVLGAFLTPLLIGGDVDGGVFPLAYVALINVPVILLGLRRKWQVLYNLAFIFTVFYFVVWLDWIGRHEWWIGLAFAIGFFLQFAALGLLKLRSEQKIAGRTADIIRLVAASLLLLGTTYWIFEESALRGWLGTAFLLLALLHVALAFFAFRLLARFNEEILAFLAGGLVFATLALPAQLDGDWVSIGWAVEGAAVAWFAARISSGALRNGAFLLGLIGIMKSLVFDLTLYDTHPTLFLNARFCVGLLSAGLLGVQGWLAGRGRPAQAATVWQELLWWVGICGAIGVFFADAFWTLGAADAFAWMITSLVLVLAAALLVLFVPPHSSLNLLGGLLLMAVPIKILLIDAGIGIGIRGYGLVPFANSILWLQLAALAIILLFLQPRLRASGVAYPMPTVLISLLSLAAAIGVVTLEIQRNHTDWANTAVTILWAVSALALTLFGMARRTAAHRYFGLVLIGLTTVKVLFIDSAELKGLERIAAFVGSGILLLLLSFAYQKASAYFHSLGDQQ